MPGETWGSLAGAARHVELDELSQREASCQRRGCELVLPRTTGGMSAVYVHLASDHRCSVGLVVSRLASAFLHCCSAVCLLSVCAWGAIDGCYLTHVGEDHKHGVRDLLSLSMSAARVLPPSAKESPRKLSLPRAAPLVDPSATPRRPDEFSETLPLSLPLPASQSPPPPWRLARAREASARPLAAPPQSTRCQS